MFLILVFIFLMVVGVGLAIGEFGLHRSIWHRKRITPKNTEPYLPGKELAVIRWRVTVKNGDAGNPPMILVRLKDSDSDYYEESDARWGPERYVRPRTPEDIDKGLLLAQRVADERNRGLDYNVMLTHTAQDRLRAFEEERQRKWRESQSPPEELSDDYEGQDATRDNRSAE